MCYQCVRSVAAVCAQSNVHEYWCECSLLVSLVTDQSIHDW